jgi:hypothetical protein
MSCYLYIYRTPRKSNARWITEFTVFLASSGIYVYQLLEIFVTNVSTYDFDFSIFSFIFSLSLRRSFMDFRLRMFGRSWRLFMYLFRTDLNSLAVGSGRSVVVCLWFVSRD